jgi:hypothetical protein
MSCDSLTLALRLENFAASQYVGYPFNSVVEFNGKAVFFGDDGIFEEGGGTLDGTDIASWVDFPLHDFGKREQKSIEALDLGFEAAADLIVTLTPDEKTDYARVVPMSPVKSGSGQQDGMQTLRKVANGKARYWGVRIANTEGSDFSIDYLALAPVVLNRRAM